MTPKIPFNENNKLLLYYSDTSSHAQVKFVTKIWHQFSDWSHLLGPFLNGERRRREGERKGRERGGKGHGPLVNVVIIATLRYAT